MITQFLKRYQALVSFLDHFSGLGPFAMRAFLFWPLFFAGWQKFQSIDATAQWFEHSLNIPFASTMAYLAASTELIGAILLLLGLLTRLSAIPLLITMVVAAVSVHWKNGWSAIASSSDPDIAVRLERGRSILQEYGNYDWLTEQGSWVILNNGIEFAATYAVMLIALIFSGGGRYLSLDYWLQRRLITANN